MSFHIAELSVHDEPDIWVSGEVFAEEWGLLVKRAGFD
jgi:hypothetical protein